MNLKNLMLSERGYARMHCMIYACTVLAKANAHREREEIRGCRDGGAAGHQLQRGMRGLGAVIETLHPGYGGN